MKKQDEDFYVLSKNKTSNNQSENKIKTTNVNILLNRVRQDKKRVLKKK